MAAIATKDNIINAMQTLADKGINVTIPNLHKELGGGSFSTISKIYNEIKSEQTVETPKPTPLSDDITKPVIDVLYQIHAQAQKEALDLIALERQALADAQALARQEVQESMIAYDDLQDKYSELLTSSIDQTARIDQLKNDISIKDQTVADLLARVDMQAKENARLNDIIKNHIGKPTAKAKATPKAKAQPEPTII